MAEEIELKLALSRRAVKTLLAHPLLLDGEIQRQRLHNTYFDTPDLTLHAAQIELRQRRTGRHLLQTVKAGTPSAGGLASRSEWEQPAEPEHFDFSTIDDKQVRHHLERHCDDLRPIFTTEFSRVTWQLRVHPDSLIELALDRGVIASRERTAPICEVELELKAGSATDLFELAQQLQQTVPLHPAAAGKAQRGYVLWRGEAPRPVKAKPPTLEKDMSPLSALRTIALTCVQHLQDNEDGVRTVSDEPEYIHQTRVAVRRLRSALKLFSGVLPTEFIEHWDPRWRDFGRQLGQARNWDMFATQTLPPLAAAFPDSAEIRQLVKTSERHRSACLKAVRAAITSDTHSRLLLDFTAALHALEPRTPPAASGLGDFASDRLARLAKRAKKSARRVEELDASERHHMRIAFKKLRYALEFLAPLLPTRRLKSYSKELEKLQDALGELNDLAVAQQLITEVSGVRSDGVAAGWLAASHDVRLRALPKKLNCFLQIRSPWR